MSYINVICVIHSVWIYWLQWYFHCQSHQWKMQSAPFGNLGKQLRLLGQSNSICPNNLYERYDCNEFEWDHQQLFDFEDRVGYKSSIPFSKKTLLKFFFWKWTRYLHYIRTHRHQKCPHLILLTRFSCFPLMLSIHASHSPISRLKSEEQHFSEHIFLSK